MDSKEAVQAAKNCVLDHFANEGLANVGLEEIDFDHGGIWEITIGFSRSWNNNIATVLGGGQAGRSYKIIQINDKDGRIMSIKDRQLSPLGSL